MKVYQNLKDFLFFDIETVREYKTYEEFAAKRSTKIWEHIAKKYMKDEDITAEQAYLTKAGLHVEYGKVVSIAIGYFEGGKKIVGPLTDKENKCAYEDEKALLTRFRDFLNGRDIETTILCGWNIKEFDIQYVTKRMIYHGIVLPQMLVNYFSVKPWEVLSTDMQFDWRMAGPRFVGLDAAADFLGIPSSKQGDVEGSKLGEFYYDETNPLQVRLKSINDYCAADVRVCLDLGVKLISVLP